MSSNKSATVSKKRKGSSKSKKSTKKQKTEYYNLSKIMKEDVIVTAYYQNRSLVDVYLRLFSGCKLFILQYACQWGWNDVIIKIIKDKDTQFDPTDEYVRKSFGYAIRQNHASTVTLLLENGLDPNNDIGNWCPLYVATFYGRLDTLKVLLNHPKIKPINSLEFSLINVACYRGFFDIVEELCKYSDVDITRVTIIKRLQGKAMTSIHIAAFYGHCSIVSLLIDKGVDPDLKCFNDFTPLILATYKGYYDIVQVLLNKGADPNQTDANLGTALHMAARINRIFIAKILLNDPRTFEKLNIRGQSPWDVALLEFNFDLMDLFITKGSLLDENPLPSKVSDVFDSDSEYDFTSEEIDFLQSVLV